MEKISADKQYEYITGHLQYLNEKIIQSFTLFIKLAMAIIAGTFTLYWKLVDKCYTAMSGYWVQVTNWSFFFISVGTILLILNNLRSWRRYRITLSEEYGIKRRSGWWLNEGVMVIFIMVSLIGFCFWNPLSPLNTWWLPPIIALLIVLLISLLYFRKDKEVK